MVQGNKSRRIGYRILGCLFLIVCALQCITLFKGYADHVMLTAMFLAFCIYYGIYLIARSFRKQSFDITYKFSEEGVLITHHYGETNYTFEDIEFITMVAADPEMMLCILNMKAGKNIYTIPFTMKKEYCEKIYDFVNDRIKKEDTE